MKKKVLRYMGYGGLFYVMLSTIFCLLFKFNKRFRNFMKTGINDMANDYEDTTIDDILGRHIWKIN